MSNAQDTLNKLFLEDDEASSNATLDLFRFMKNESTPLNENQLKALYMLESNGLSDLAHFAIQSRSLVTHNSIYFKTLEKLTLADRIKGNAKLSHLVKSTATGDPAQGLNPKELQAQGMSRREIDRY